MDGQSRLTVNLPMQPQRKLNFFHIRYVMWDPHIIKNNFLPPSSSLPNTPLPPSDQELISITEGTPLWAPHKSIQHVTWSLLHTQHPTSRKLTVNTVIVDGNHSFAPRSQVQWYFCSLRNFSHRNATQGKVQSYFCTFALTSIVGLLLSNIIATNVAFLTRPFTFLSIHLLSVD